MGEIKVAGSTKLFLPPLDLTTMYDTKYGKVQV